MQARRLAGCCWCQFCMCVRLAAAGADDGRRLQLAVDWQHVSGSNSQRQGASAPGTVPSRLWRRGRRRVRRTCSASTSMQPVHTAALQPSNHSLTMLCPCYPGLPCCPSAGRARQQDCTGAGAGAQVWRLLPGAPPQLFPDRRRWRVHEPGHAGGRLAGGGWCRGCTSSTTALLCLLHRAAGGAALP